MRARRWWAALGRVASGAWRPLPGRPHAPWGGRIELARRADRNGRALLELADEIERFLACQQWEGRPVSLQRHWPRLCRQVAAEHLECINRLMLDGAWDEENAARGKD
ncbi:hypothetical protein K4L06_16985 [Lysobacter sp. BMK333-48F3]|uniref:hypothetical protein n=1 Tax=Lysobacter sp. BMK333-48F3 TaxID=2867962 RepID=UPI001C8CD38A|nr:hypothetical protein [Lysobacter sp. BMK333-48F3]MBX9403005.1 hypothetical protein [Lysobacter sp. BMK333-48F3]